MVGIAFYVALFFTCLPFMFLCLRALRSSWDNKNDEVYEALRSPSVRNARNAFDRRVALAIREARQGFRTCGGCQFTNTARATSCVLCGAAMPLPPKKLLDRLGLKRERANCEAEIRLTDISLEHTSTRQQRVRLRKLWTRHVDSQGRIAWLHNAGGSGLTQATEFPSYVLRTTRVTTADANEAAAGEPSPRSVPVGRDKPEMQEADAADHVGIDIETPGEPVEQAPELTLPLVTRLLEKELALHEISVVNASEANPSHVAFAPTMASGETTQSMADTANIAKLDFPSKMAQFITSVASLFHDMKKVETSGRPPVSRFSIKRASLLSDSINALATMSPELTRGAIRVEFIDEQGIDAGGVYREWFLLLNESIVKPEAGIFVCMDQHEQTFYLNPRSREILGEHHLGCFFAAGRLLGRALLEGNVTGFHLALPLLKIILGLPVGFHDLQYVDPEAYRNLKWLLDNDGVDSLGLDFTVSMPLPDGTVREVELVPNGSQIDLTDANKLEYVDRKLQYLLFGSVQSQLFAFLNGLYEVVPAELLMVFDAEELDYVLSGSDEIDVDDWEAHTLTSRNLRLHPAFFNFWIVVRELSAEQRQRLLQYATGSTRLPPGGFSALTSHDGRLSLFTLRGVPTDATWGCIHAHACFNRLDIPMHRDLETMREAVWSAVEIETVGFTTA